MSEVRVGVAGATGALGSEIITVLDRASWRPDQLVPLARATTSTSHVEYGSERVAVDDLQEEALDGLDALFLALPEDAARVAGEAAVQAGVPVIDCSGAFASEADVPLVVPWINPEALGDVPRGLLAVPSAEVILLASVLGPLRRAGIEGAMVASVLVPASAQGRAGIDELSRQVVSLFNSATPPRKIFEQGLAFDLLPSLGDDGDDAASSRERMVVEQLSRMVAATAPWDVTLVGVPVFSGVSATVALRPNRPVSPEIVRKVLADGGVVFPEAAGARYLPRPRRVEGKAFAHAARVRLGADGQTLHLWLSMDNLRTTATAAVASCAALLQLGRGA